MDDLLAALRQVGAWLIAVTVGGIALLFILRAILPGLANTALVFIASPGGLFLILAIWWWSRRRKS